MIKKKICIDFDGVIYPNERFIMVDNIREIPYSGTLDAIRELSKTYKILVHSVRCNSDKGYQAVKDWITLHGFDQHVEVVNYKPLAHVYIDDRAIRFDGEWGNLIKQLEEFRQWQGK